MTLEQVMAAHCIFSVFSAYNYYQPHITFHSLCCYFTVHHMRMKLVHTLNEFYYVHHHYLVGLAITVRLFVGYW